MQSDDDAQEEEAVRNRQPSTRPSHAFIAVFSILLVAFTNPSLTGIASGHAAEILVHQVPICSILDHTYMTHAVRQH